MTAELKLLSLNDSEAERAALAIYVRMPVVRFLTIAKRVGRTRQQIEEWARSGRFTEARDTFQRQQQEQLLEGLPTLEKLRKDTLSSLCDVFAECRRRLSRSSISQYCSPGDLSKLVELQLSVLAEVEKRLSRIK